MRVKRLLTACLLAIPLAAADPSAQVLRVEPAKAVSNFTFSMPHAQFTLSSGRAGRVFKGDACVGFCFEGSGAMNYVSQLATEATVIKYNLTRNGGAVPQEVKDGLQASIGFQRAIFWFGGRDVPTFTGQDEAPLDGVLQTTFARFNHDGVTSGLTGALSYRANARPLPYTQADLDPRTGPPVVYELDPYHSRFESLYLLSHDNMQDPAVNGYFHPITISKQPVGWDLHRPVPGEYMLQSVAVDLTQTAPLQAALKVKETLVPVAWPIKSIRMNLDRDHWALKGRGLDLHQEKVSRVTDDQGHTLPFAQDATEITIELPAFADPGSKVQLAFEIEGDFLIPPGNDNYWQLGTTAWFPQPDLNGQMYTWDAIVRVKKPWQAFSCGDTVRRWEEGEYAAVEMKSDVPIAFGVILAGDYLIERETREGRTVEVAMYSSKAQFSKELMDIAFYVLKYYESFLGSYPYKEFHILEKNEWGYGQAPASIMFITKEAFNQTLTPLNSLFAVGIRERFVHEIAHQWWGTVVKMPSHQEQWITEAFAEACAGLCLQDWPHTRVKSEYAKLVARWKTEGSIAATKGTIPTCNYNYDPDDGRERFYARTGLLYDKGAWLLYAIRKEIGDDQFRVFLKSYQTNFRWKFGSTKDVAGLLSFITKKDWNPWFEKNYWGTGFPEAKD